MLLHARPILRGPHLGFYEALSLKSGSYLLHSCGSMVNVRSVFSPKHENPLTPIFVAGSGKSVLWFVVSCYCLPASTQIFA